MVKLGQLYDEHIQYIASYNDNGCFQNFYTMFVVLNVGFSVLLYCDPVCLPSRGRPNHVSGQQHQCPMMFHVYANGTLPYMAWVSGVEICLMFWKETYSLVCVGMQGRVQVCVN